MQRQSAFTLIELMVTIAIIAILAGIALPSYTQYVLRGKLVEGHTNLLAMRTKMEMYFQDNRSYVGACVAWTSAALPGSLKHFDFKPEDCTIPVPVPPDPPQYRIVARGKAGTDLAGLALSIDQANVRRTESVPAGWTLPAGNCWITKKSGEC
jgi:type IV pilus assembly protein PilE